MARLPRVVIPGIPHHVTQRGNRRERTFFEDGDYALYLDLLADAARRAQVDIWSYCLMPNHVHIRGTVRRRWPVAEGSHRAYPGTRQTRPCATEDGVSLGVVATVTVIAVIRTTVIRTCLVGQVSMINQNHNLMLNRMVGLYINHIKVGASSLIFELSGEAIIAIDVFGFQEDVKTPLYSAPLCGEKSVQSICGKSIVRCAIDLNMLSITLDDSSKIELYRYEECDTIRIFFNDMDWISL